jgi:hypothetical protein
MQRLALLLPSLLRLFAATPALAKDEMTYTGAAARPAPNDRLVSTDLTT